MRLVIQRVKSAQVTVEGQITGSIDTGLLVLVGIHEDDTAVQVIYLVKKLIGMRIFNDENGKMNLSLEQVQGRLLVVSQFTLYADTAKGNRPSFITAARPEVAIPLYELFLSHCRELLGNERVQSGVFGADMLVELANDGPVTIVIDSQ